MKRGIAVFVSGVLVMLYTVVSWVAAVRLVEPPRKAFLPRHRDGIVDMRARGFEIHRALTRSGIPYLMCEAKPDSKSRRGAVLRSQLRLLGRKDADMRRSNGTVVLLHGWGMRKEDLLRTAERFAAIGFRCLMPDLPGHGDNGATFTGFGSARGEDGIALDVLDEAAARFDFDPHPAMLWGMSMGGAYAIAASAAQPDRWNAMVVVCTFDELEPIVRNKVRAEAGAACLALTPAFDLAVRCRTGTWPSDIRPIRDIAHVAIPTMIVHGDSDDIIPFSRGQRLYEALSYPGRRWIAVAGGGHGNVLNTPQLVYREMADWMLSAGTQHH